MLVAVSIILLGLANNSALVADGVDPAVSIWRIIAALAFCLALGLGAIFALRSRLSLFTIASGGKARRLVLIEQITLGPQRSACIISIDNTEYLALLSGSVVQIVPLTPLQIKDET
jgi:flagellar biogenesis protein FliO